MRIVLARLVPVALLAAVLTGCAAGASAYKKGYTAAKVHDWDTAVAHFRTAVQDDPDKPEYQIALERAMMEAALMHASAGKDFEAQGQLDAALREYHRASEYDPSNRQLAARVVDVDRRIAEQIEASRPRPKIDVMRERARRMTPEPTLNPTSREPLDLHFTGSVRDLLKFIADATGINITFTGDYRDPPQYSIQISGVTLEQALQQVLSANALFYKVLNERTILVIPDTAQNRNRYEEMVVRTFYLSHADAAGRRAAAERGDARAGRADGAGLLCEQEPELDHRPRVGAAGGDHGAARRGQRPAAGRDHPRRADPGGQPGPREAVRARPERVFHHGRLLSRGPAPGDRGGTGSGQPGAAAVQPEHDLARHERGRLLPVGPDGDRHGSSRPTRRPSWLPSRSSAGRKGRRSR